MNSSVQTIVDRLTATKEKADVGDYGIYRKETYTATKNGGGFKKGDRIYVTSAMYAPDYMCLVNKDINREYPYSQYEVSCTYADFKACGLSLRGKLVCKK